jgi:hypothetical protein
MAKHNKHAIWVGLELKKILDKYSHEKEFKSKELALEHLLNQSEEYKKFKEFLESKPKFEVETKGV